MLISERQGLGKISQCYVQSAFLLTETYFLAKQCNRGKLRPTSGTITLASMIV